MDSFCDDSLHTTQSSIDLGTTLEHTVCFTSTPVKLVHLKAEVVAPLGSPPPKPNVSKPNAAICRLTLEDFASSTAPKLQARHRNLRFKRQRLELRLGYLQNRTCILRNRDDEIRIRHSELIGKRNQLMVNSSGSSEDDSEGEVAVSKRPRLSQDNVDLQKQGNNFRRNSLKRKASRKRSRPSPVKEREDLVLHEVNPNTAGLTDFKRFQPDICEPTQEPLTKVRKTRSFRKFVQKKFSIRFAL